MDLNSGIGDSLSTDYFLLREEFTPAQLDYLQRARALRAGRGAAGDQRLLGARRVPLAAGREARQRPAWSATASRATAARRSTRCPPAWSPWSSIAGDGSIGTFLGVQAGLAMRSIAMLGSEEQKQRWLPRMARVERLGAFALTEPDHGSDSIALETIGPPRRRLVGARRGEEVDRQRQHRRRRRGVGARRGRRPGQGLPGREGHARLRRKGHRGQGIAARGLAGRDRPDGCAGPGREPAAGRASRSATCAAVLASTRAELRVGRARARGGGLRRRADLRQAAHAVRQAARRPSS